MAINCNLLIERGLVGTACADANIGGVTKILITNRSAVGDITLTNGGLTGSANSFVTEIFATGSTSTPPVFYEYDVRRETASYTETLNKGDNGSLFYGNALTIVLDRMEKIKRDELMLLDRALVTVIFRDANGIFWMFGYNEAAEVSANTGQTGVARTDANGYTLTLTEAGPQRAYVVSPAIIEDLYTPNTP